MIRDSGVFWRVLGILVFIAMMVMPACAQMDVLVEPSSLTIAETQPYPVVFGVPVTVNPARENATGIAPGDTSTIRTLTLWVAENVTVLSVRPTDLVRDDNAYTISPSVINATLPSDELMEEGIASVPVSIQLGGIRSGKFTGNLLVTYRGEDEKRGTLKVPVTVTVKDALWGPLAVLGFGVLLGIGYFSYSAKGKRRDELLQRYEHLEAEISRDQDFRNLDPSLFFKAVIDRNLRQTRILFSIPNLDEAEKTINGAYEAWGQWLEYRSSMIRQMEDRAGLQQELRSLGDLLKSHGEFQYIQAIEQNLVFIFDELAKPRTYGEFTQAFQVFSDKLMKERESLTQFTRLKGLMEVVEKRVHDKKTIDDFWDRLKVLGPNDPGIQTLEKDLQKETGAGLHPPVPTLPEEPKLPTAPGKGEPGGLWDRVKTTLGMGLSWAGIRLGIFGFVSFFILLVLLVIMGFQQLYLANATFGAGPADYFGLFLWGLGVGPGSDAAVKTVRDQFGG